MQNISLLRVTGLVILALIILLFLGGGFYAVNPSQVELLLSQLNNPTSYAPPNQIEPTSNQELSSFRQEFINNYPDINFMEETPAAINPKQPAASSIKQAAWIPDWDMNNGLTSLRAVADKLDSVSPVWYHLNEDGSVRVNRAGLSQLKNVRSTTGVKIIPSIASFDAGEFRNAVNTPEKLANHIEFLKQEVKRYDLDGIDLDYESMYLENQPQYMEIIRELYTYLDQQDKLLTIAVMPKWTDNHNYPGLIQTRQVQDWNAIGPYVHEFRIMSYNLTSAGSKYPGPIAPMDWMDAILRYGRTTVDPEKLSLGIHLYAYGGWGERPTRPEPYIGINSNPYAGEIKASALTYDGILDRRAGTISDELDPVTGEGILSYRRQGQEYIGYYMDADAVQLRKQLALEYGINKVAYWRMGGEELSLY